MNTTDLKIEMLRAGVTSLAIARELGINPTMVSLVLNGHRQTPYVRRAIATAIGCTYERVWGEEDPGIDRLPLGRPPSADVNTFTRKRAGAHLCGDDLDE